MRKQEHVLGQKMEQIMKIRKLVLFMVMMVAFAIMYGCLSTSGGLGQAEKFVAEKDYQGAVDTYNEIIQSKPGSEQGWKAQLGLAKLYIEKMDLPDKVLKSIKTWLRLHLKAKKLQKPIINLEFATLKLRSMGKLRNLLISLSTNFPV